MRGGVVDALLLPAPTDIAQALWTDRSLLAEDLAVTTGEVVLGLAAALVRRRRARRRDAPLGARAQGAAPAGDRLAGRAGAGDRAAVHPRARLRPGAEGADGRARLLLPGDDQPLRRAARRRPGRAQAAALARRHALAAAAPARGAQRAPATFTGIKIAAAVAVIGAVFAEWAGSDRGLGHTLLIANGQLETARAFAATFLLFALAIALYGAVRAARAARRGLDAPTAPQGGP